MKNYSKKIIKIIVFTFFFLHILPLTALAVEPVEYITTFKGYQIWEVEDGQKQAISNMFKDVSSLGVNPPILESHKKYQVYGLSNNGLIPISGIITETKDLDTWLAMAVQTELQEKKQERNIMVVSCIMFAGFIFLFYQIIKEKKG